MVSGAVIANELVVCHLVPTTPTASILWSGKRFSGWFLQGNSQQLLARLAVWQQKKLL